MRAGDAVVELAPGAPRSFATVADGPWFEERGLTGPFLVSESVLRDGDRVTVLGTPGEEVAGESYRGAPLGTLEAGLDAPLIVRA